MSFKYFLDVCMHFLQILWFLCILQKKNKKQTPKLPIVVNEYFNIYEHGVR